MPDTQRSVLPPGLRQASLFTQLIGVAKKDLARHREYGFVGEPFQERREKLTIHAHVAIEQHDDVILGGAKASVRSSAKSQVAVKRQYSHGREMFAQEFRAAVFRAIVYNDNLVLGIAGQGFHDGRDVLFQKIAAIPIGNHNTCRTVVGPLVWWKRFLAEH